MSVVSGVVTLNHKADKVEDELLCQIEKDPNVDCESTTIADLCQGDKPCQKLTKEQIESRVRDTLKNLLENVGLVETTELSEEIQTFMKSASYQLSKEDDIVYEASGDELKRIYSIVLTPDKQIRFDKNTKMSLKEFVSDPSKRKQFKKYREQLTKNARKPAASLTPFINSQGHKTTQGISLFSGLSQRLGLRAQGGKPKKTKKAQKKAKRSTRARGRK